MTSEFHFGTTIHRSTSLDTIDTIRTNTDAIWPNRTFHLTSREPPPSAYCSVLSRCVMYMHVSGLGVRHKFSMQAFYLSVCTGVSVVNGLLERSLDRQQSFERLLCIARLKLHGMLTWSPSIVFIIRQVYIPLCIRKIRMYWHAKVSYEPGISDNNRA